MNSYFGCPSLGLQGRTKVDSLYIFLVKTKNVFSRVKIIILDEEDRGSLTLWSSKSEKNNKKRLQLTKLNF